MRTRIGATLALIVSACAFIGCGGGGDDTRITGEIKTVKKENMPAEYQKTIPGQASQEQIEATKKAKMGNGYMQKGSPRTGS